jgi:hypothetical protein
MHSVNAFARATARATFDVVSDSLHVRKRARVWESRRRMSAVRPFSSSEVVAIRSAA